MQTRYTMAGTVVAVMLAAYATSSAAGQFMQRFTQPGGEPDYDYLQAGWVIDHDLDFEGMGIDRDSGDGLLLEASIELNDELSLPGYVPGVFLFGETTATEADTSAGSTDIDTISLGAGIHHGMALPRVGYLDAYTTLSFEEFDIGGRSDEGLGIGTGLRWVPVKALEVHPYGRYLEFGSGNFDLDGWRYGVETLLNLTDHVALSAEWAETRLETGSPNVDGVPSNADVALKNTITVGARLYYE